MEEISNRRNQQNVKARREVEKRCSEMSWEFLEILENWQKTRRFAINNCNGARKAKFEEI